MSIARAERGYVVHNQFVPTNDVARERRDGSVRVSRPTGVKEYAQLRITLAP